MKPLEPGHPPVGVVANQARIDSVGVQNRLCHMRFDLIGKRSDDRVELGLILLHLLSIGVRTRTSASEICISDSSTASPELSVWHGLCATNQHAVNSRQFNEDATQILASCSGPPF